jgi:single-strand DNA-binding protein
MMFSNLFTLGRDAEVRYTQSGDPVATLSLAYNYGRKGQDGRMPTQWVEAALWGKLAESLQPYLLKGGKVYADLDDVHIEEYQARDGATKAKLVAKIANIKLAGSRQEAAEQQQTYAEPQRPAPTAQKPRQAAQKPVAAADLEDDTIPF